MKHRLLRCLNGVSPVNWVRALVINLVNDYISPTRIGELSTMLVQLG